MHSTQQDKRGLLKQVTDFWYEVMQDDQAGMTSRIRASEQLWKILEETGGDREITICIRYAGQEESREGTEQAPCEMWVRRGRDGDCLDDGRAMGQEHERACAPQEEQIPGVPENSEHTGVLRENRAAGMPEDGQRVEVDSGDEQGD